MSRYRFMMEQTRRSPQETLLAITIGNSFKRSMDGSRSIYLQIGYIKFVHKKVDKSLSFWRRIKIVVEQS